MSKKRRVFDIDLSDEDLSAPPKPVAAEPRITTLDGSARRGPMASAVRENADSLRSRADQERAIREENDRLAHEHVRLKRAGLITDLVDVTLISTAKLTRDRTQTDDDELADLVTSIRDIGLSNPIQVEQIAPDQYELIQGYRRLSAYKLLLAETGDVEKWGRVPAGIVATGKPLHDLYRRMVDENLVRKDISFAEMAVLAQKYARDPETETNNVEDAVLVLYRSVGKQKRSYIRAFGQLLDLIGDALIYPEAISRNVGLALRKRLDEVPGTTRALQAALVGLGPSRLAEAEQEVLRLFAGRAGAGQGTGATRAKGGAVQRPAKTTFRLERPRGAARCTASNGRLEVRLDTDFSAKDRRKLEVALADFLAALEE